MSLEDVFRSPQATPSISPASLFFSTKPESSRISCSPQETQGDSETKRGWGYQLGLIPLQYSPTAKANVLERIVDVLGRTRATLTETTSSSPWPEGLGNLVKLCRAGDRALQLLLFNEECLVSASHQLALITSLPFSLPYKGLIVINHNQASSRLDTINAFQVRGTLVLPG